jgi:hypothetical protein
MGACVAKKMVGDGHIQLPNVATAIQVDLHKQHACIVAAS